MEGAGVAGQLLTVASEHPVDWRVVQLAGQVPQGNVDGPYAHAVLLAQKGLGLIVKTLPFEGAPSYEKGSECLNLLYCSRCYTRVFACDAFVGLISGVRTTESLIRFLAATISSIVIRACAFIFAPVAALVGGRRT